VSEDELYKTKAYWLGYLAGILDGEGTISLHKVRRNIIRGKIYERGFDWHPCVQIGSSEVEVLNTLQDICEGGTVHKANTWKGKQFYVLSIPPNTQRDVLQKIRLVIKERHRVLLLEALEKIGRWNKTLVNEIRLTQIYEEFKKLNVKGRNKRKLGEEVELYALL